MTLQRKKTYDLHTALALTVDDTDYPSEEIDCSQEAKFLLMYDITETGVLVNGDRVIFTIQFREPGGTWRDYANGPFGFLAEEESTTPCNKAVSGDCIGEKMRLIATTDYTNADPTTNYFTITTKLTLLK